MYTVYVWENSVVLNSVIKFYFSLPQGDCAQNLYAKIVSNTSCSIDKLI